MHGEIKDLTIFYLQINGKKINNQKEKFLVLCLNSKFVWHICYVKWIKFLIIGFYKGQ